MIDILLKFGVVTIIVAIIILWKKSLKINKVHFYLRYLYKIIDYDIFKIYIP